MRPIDVFDIAFVSMLIFVALTIVHRHIHRRIVVTFLTFIGVYLVARFYQLALTLRLIETAAFSFAVGSVLIFQEDIRRFLESSLFSFFSAAKNQSSGTSWVKVLLKSVDTFSKNRVGALIVLQQNIPISHAVRGGHKLNGEVSFPLLCSLFDPHSIGHDGAVVIRGSRVTRFGVHLPLSRNYQATGRIGTRHSAALGLSEVTDAFVIVVSEETGDIGIATHKMFHKVTLKDLEERLTILKGVKDELGIFPAMIQWLRRALLPNFISLTLASALWLIFVAPGASQQRTISMPLVLQEVPKGLLVDEPAPAEVKVTLVGTAETFSLWSKEKQNIHLGIQEALPGVQKIHLSNQHLSLPEEMKVAQFEPSFVTLNVHRSRKVNVPISLQMNNRSLASTNKFRFEPKEVTLIIRSEDAGPALVSTEPMDPSKYKKGDNFDLKLILPSKANFSNESASTIHVQVE